jgi:glutathionylspermidine synthase
VRRIPIDPRPDWLPLVESQGLLYASWKDDSGVTVPYWHESAYYELTGAEVEHLEDVVEELHGMCVAAARHVVASGDLTAFGLPEAARDYLRLTLEEEHPSVYGRFDLVWGGEGSGEVKLLEYNADTPTAVIEASLVQWYWLQDRFPEKDQWNSLHERLVRAWAKTKPYLRSETVHFAHIGGTDEEEEWMTAAYLRDTASEAGLTTVGLEVKDLGWDPERLRFVDLGDHGIDTVFMLYPWEDMLVEPFGQHVLDHPRACLFVEPAWKALLSNKALLAVLWELYPDHPNLLPAYLDSPRGMTSYVAKPLHGREGDAVRIVTPEGVHEQDSVHYGAEGFCFQEYVALPDFDRNLPVLGAWVVDGEAAGLGIRESDGPVTDDYARFLPHVVDTPAPSEEQRRAWLEE